MPRLDLNKIERDTREYVKQSGNNMQLVFDLIEYARELEAEAAAVQRHSVASDDAT